MYYEHFGLQYPPFKITPDPRLFFAGGKRGLILEALVYAITSGEGMVKVVGEVGSGKTMLCRMLAEKLPKSVELIYLANPRLTPDTILQAIALEMELPVVRQQPPADRLQIMHSLQQALLDKHTAGRQVVALVEEAQGMPLETLEEIRLLSNLETSRDKLLQLVLFGQPELDKNLTAPHIRQLKERITHSFTLKPFNHQEVTEYLDFRMRAAGYRGPGVFKRGAVRLLCKNAQGLLRRVNVLADKALLAVYAEDKYLVRACHMRRAIADSGFLDYSGESRSSWQWGGAVAVLVLVALTAWLWWQGWLFHFPPPTVSPATAVPVVTAMSEAEVLAELHTHAAADAADAAPVVAGESGKKADLPTAAEAESAQAAPPPLSITEQRLNATRAWLARQEAAYTLQIMRLDSDMPDKIERLLRSSVFQPLQAEIYLHREQRATRIIWLVFYGRFAKHAEAQAAIHSLPAPLKAGKPFVRSFASVFD